MCLWTPDSRICLENNATPAFKQLWANMGRQSFQTYQTLLGLPGNPVGSEDFGPGTHPFSERYVQRNTMMMFNISSYARLNSFLLNIHINPCIGVRPWSSL